MATSRGGGPILGFRDIEGRRLGQPLNGNICAAQEEQFLVAKPATD
jgi:hypothetical protein